MVFESIVGQAPAIETLKRGLSTERLHHAYRFEGPAGVGKRTTAFALAQSLLCKDASHGEGCGSCGSCSRVVALNEDAPRVPLHPDLLLVQRGLYTGTLLNSKEANGISVEQIRKVVLPRITHPPHEGPALVVVVADAEELTVSAANALLKTLEEPRHGVHFILLTAKPGLLLDTIRSRTQALRFGALPEELVSSLLQQKGYDRALASEGHGSIGLALELADSTLKEDLQGFCVALDRATEAPTLADAVEVAGSLPKDRSAVQARLLAYAQFQRQHARAVAAANPSLAARHAQRFSKTLSAAAQVTRNASASLVVEALVSELREI